MIEALILAAATFAGSFVGLSALEWLIHKLTKNPDKSYRWGVWLFSILIAAYAFLTSLGR